MGTEKNLSPLTRTTTSHHLPLGSSSSTTTIDWRSPFENATLLPWDTFSKPPSGVGGSGNGSGSGVSVIQQLPFAAYQSVAAISTQPTGTDEQLQFHTDSAGVEGGGRSDSFVSWASTTSPSQVLFIVKVVLMCFIIVSQPLHVPHDDSGLSEMSALFWVTVPPALRCSG